MQKKLFILFGATGDLSREKLLASAFSYFQKHSGDFIFLGVSRRNFSTEDFRNFIKEYIPHTYSDEFLQSVHYVSGTFDDLHTYQKIKSFIDGHDVSGLSVYLAVSPHFFSTIIKVGYEADLWSKDSATHVLIEKPYAHTAEEFDHIKHTIDTYLGNNAYFIDHYLGKTALQDVLHMRYADKNFESRLNKDSVARIEISLFEANNVEKRSTYYDAVGAFIDVGANHMLQMLSLVGTDLVSPQYVCASKDVFLGFLHITHAKKLQYTGYAEHNDVAPNSHTETAFEIELMSHETRWEGVPFILKGGKAFSVYKSGISVFFKDGSVYEVGLKPHEYMTYKDHKTEYHTSDAYDVIVGASFGEGGLCFVTLQEACAEWNLIKVLQHIWSETTPEQYEINSNPF